MLVMSVLFTTVYSGVALNTDRTKGVIDRFRSLPVLARGAAARVAARRRRALRRRRHGDHRPRRAARLPPGRGSWGAVSASRWSSSSRSGLSWVFSTLGLLLRSPSAVMNGGFMAIFPLTFLSNVFVDPATLPSVLRAFVDVNPISLLATASRGLMDGTPQSGDVTASCSSPPAHGRLRAADDAALPAQLSSAGGPVPPTRLGAHGPRRAEVRWLVRVRRRAHQARRRAHRRDPQGRPRRLRRGQRDG
jgi:hypothetical protein